jgi:hypothetical protein
MRYENWPNLSARQELYGAFVEPFPLPKIPIFLYVTQLRANLAKERLCKRIGSEPSVITCSYTGQPKSYWTPREELVKLAQYGRVPDEPAQGRQLWAPILPAYTLRRIGLWGLPIAWLRGPGTKAVRGAGQDWLAVKTTTSRWLESVASSRFAPDSSARARVVRRARIRNGNRPGRGVAAELRLRSRAEKVLRR